MLKHRQDAGISRRTLPAAIRAGRQSEARQTGDRSVRFTESFPSSSSSYIIIPFSEDEEQQLTAKNSRKRSGDSTGTPRRSQQPTEKRNDRRASLLTASTKTGGIQSGHRRRKHRDLNEFKHQVVVQVKLPKFAQEPHQEDGAAKQSDSKIRHQREKSVKRQNQQTTSSDKSHDTKQSQPIQRQHQKYLDVNQSHQRGVSVFKYLAHWNPVNQVRPAEDRSSASSDLNSLKSDNPDAKKSCSDPSNRRDPEHQERRNLKTILHYLCQDQMDHQGFSLNREELQSLEKFQDRILQNLKYLKQQNDMADSQLALQMRSSPQPNQQPESIQIELRDQQQQQRQQLETPDGFNATEDSVHDENGQQQGQKNQQAATQSSDQRDTMESNHLHRGFSHQPPDLQPPPELKSPSTGASSNQPSSLQLPSAPSSHPVLRVVIQESLQQSNPIAMQLVFPALARIRTCGGPSRMQSEPA